MTPANIPGSHDKPLSSRNDIRVRHIRNLQRREERERLGVFYIEGSRFLIQSVRYHATIETLVVCPRLLAGPPAHKLVRDLKQSGIPVLEVTPEVMHNLALVDDPQGIGAVVRQKWLRLQRVKLGGKLCWLAFDEVQSPGNLGTILRTSEAVGGAGIILLGNATDPYDPATVRASMGSIFSQRFVRCSMEELVAWKEERGWLLVGTSPTADVDYQMVRYDAPTILFMGNERKGLSEETQALCDLMVRIPMVGRSDSLNVAVATGVILYELFNQKRHRKESVVPNHRWPR